MKKFSYLTVAAVASAIFISCNETSIPSITEYGKDKIVESSKRSLSEAKEIALNATRSLDDGMSRGEAEIRTMTENDVQFILGNRSSRSADTDTLMYVFNYDDGNGFAIVSANKNTEPLICVTEAGTYNSDLVKENPGFGLYMDMAKNYVEATSGSPSSPTGPGTFEDVKRVKDTTKVVHILPKLETQWGQTNDEGKYASNGMSGCSNTAMAQIMSYFAYPSSIALTYSGATKSTQSLNWSDMKRHKIRHSHGTCNATNNAHEAISQLHRQLGEMNKSEYRSDVTWTEAYDVIDSFNELGYNASSWKSYNETNVINALQNGKLIFMGGSCEVTNEETGALETTGHHWVADGYAYYHVHVMEYTKPVGSSTWVLSEDFGYMHYKYLHMNWGWNGNSNGYFSLGVFDAARGKFDNQGTNFNNNQPYNFYNINYFDVTR